MQQFTLFDLPVPVPAGPDLAFYDWILINTSAGKDSQVTLDVVVEKARAAGVLARVLAVHCDLGRIEWEGARQLAEEQAKHYGLRFEVVRREQGDLLQHIEEHGMWPGGDTRFCTSDHKRGPVYTLMTRLADEFHGGPVKGSGRAQKDRPCRILNCLGHRREESPKRAKMAQFEHDAKASNKTRRYVDTWRPVHSWTVDQVWSRIRKTGTRWHYAYDLGMPRLSCVFCVFAPRAALIIAGHHNRELLAEHVRVEKKIDHKFRQDQTIEEVQQAVLAGEMPAAAGIIWPQCA